MTDHTQAALAHQADALMQATGTTLVGAAALFARTTVERIRMAAPEVDAAFGEGVVPRVVVDLPLDGGAPVVELLALHPDGSEAVILRLHLVVRDPGSIQ